MNEPSNEIKRDVIKNIRSSKTFKKASTSNSLLQYLLDANINGVELKESIIDIEFFRNDPNSKKNTPQVRVNIFNLRKKLNDYYESEGKSDKWQVEIDKGQYGIRFVKNNKYRLLHTVNWKHIVPYSLLIIAILFLVFNQFPKRTPKVWKSIMQKTTESKLYIGDVFGMVGTTIIGNRGWTRDYTINNYNDFYNFIERKPEFKSKLSPSPFSLNNGMAVLSTQLFQEFYQARNRSFQIHFYTRATVKQIKESNAIYVGTIVNDNKFVTFFNQANNNCQIKNRKLFITNHTQLADTVYNLGEPGGLEEYAIVAKYPASEHTDHLVFFSQHDIGVTATVEYFTNPEKIKQFTDKYLGNNNYFTAIYKVSGRDRTNIDLKLKKVIGF